eukprot:scaffold8826_cov63-Phaeocystis_antarctica.AAC.1
MIGSGHRTIHYTTAPLPVGWYYGIARSSTPPHHCLWGGRDRGGSGGARGSGAAHLAAASRPRPGRLAAASRRPPRREAPPWCASRPGELPPRAQSRNRESPQLFAVAPLVFPVGEWGGKRRVGAASRLLNGNSSVGTAVVADFAHNITADFVARLGLTALLAPTTALGSRPAPETPSGRRPARRGRAASTQNTLSEGTAPQRSWPPSAVTAEGGQLRCACGSFGRHADHVDRSATRRSTLPLAACRPTRRSPVPTRRHSCSHSTGKTSGATANSCGDSRFRLGARGGNSPGRLGHQGSASLAPLGPSPLARRPRRARLAPATCARRVRLALAPLPRAPPLPPRSLPISERISERSLPNRERLHDTNVATKQTTTIYVAGSRNIAPKPAINNCPAACALADRPKPPVDARVARPGKDNGASHIIKQPRLLTGELLASAPQCVDWTHSPHGVEFHGCRSLTIVAVRKQQRKRRGTSHARHPSMHPSPKGPHYRKAAPRGARGSCVVFCYSVGIIASRQCRGSLTRVARVPDRGGRGDRNPRNCVPAETAAKPPPIWAFRNHRVLTRAGGSIKHGVLSEALDSRRA